MLCMFFFCFFKQKTAYEMRISDWSSDVCSSDLTAVEAPVRQRCRDLHPQRPRGARIRAARQRRHGRHQRPDPGAGRLSYVRRLETLGLRSEEHPSALQSLMRISYAVLCLKKNKHINTHITHNYTSQSNTTHS